MALDAARLAAAAHVEAATDDASTTRTAAELAKLESATGESEAILRVYHDKIVANMQRKFKARIKKTTEQGRTIRALTKQLAAATAEVRKGSKTSTMLKRLVHLTVDDEELKARIITNSWLSFGQTKLGDDKSVAALQQNHRWQLIRTLRHIVGASVAAVYAHDPEGAMDLLLNDSKFRDKWDMQGGSDDEDVSGWRDGVIEGFRLNCRQGNRREAKMLLSQVVRLKKRTRRAAANDMEEAAEDDASSSADESSSTDTAQYDLAWSGVMDADLLAKLPKSYLEEGDFIKIIGRKMKGEKWPLALVVETETEEPGTVMVRRLNAKQLAAVCRKEEVHCGQNGLPVLEDPLEEKLVRSNIADGTIALDDPELVPLRYADNNEKNVRLTQYQLDAAKQHAYLHGRGAMCVAPRFQTCNRLNLKQVELWELFIQDSRYFEVQEASIANACKGAVLGTKMKPARLWKLFKKFCDAQQQEDQKARRAAGEDVDVSEEEPWSKSYGKGRKQVYESCKKMKKCKRGVCVCGTCQRHGKDNFKASRVLVDDMLAVLQRIDRPYATRVVHVFDELKARLDSLELFLDGDFLFHLAKESRTGSHCMTAQLAAPNHPHWRHPCNHDGGQLKRDEVPDDTADGHGDCHICGKTAQDGEGCGGAAYDCSLCGSRTHNKCLPQINQIPPRNVSALHPEVPFHCDNCCRDLDSVSHAMDCQRCNEIWSLMHPREEWEDVSTGGSGHHVRVSDMEQVLDVIDARWEGGQAEWADDSGDDIGKVLEALRARLEECIKSKCAYHANLIQDKWQGSFRRDYLEELVAKKCYNRAYVVFDFAGKIDPMKADEECSDVFGKSGISCHMATIVGLIPPKGTAAYEVMQKAGTLTDLDEGDGEFYQIHIHGFSDDKKQDGFATLSQIEALVGEFDRLLPWVDRVAAQSDGAGNYHNPYLMIALRHLNTRIQIEEYVISIEGMGKDLNDMNTNTMRSQQLEQLDEGWDQTTAEELARATNHGQQFASRNTAVNIVVVPNRAVQLVWDKTSGRGYTGFNRPSSGCRKIMSIVFERSWNRVPSATKVYPIHCARGLTPQPHYLHTTTCTTHYIHTRSTLHMDHGVIAASGGMIVVSSWGGVVVVSRGGGVAVSRGGVIAVSRGGVIAMSRGGVVAVSRGGVTL
jgi:hypothetical protein